MSNLQNLIELLRCHSTPGDEDEVRDMLVVEWQENGWEVTKHGPYAVSARPGPADPARPTVLVCAHMDSPGYIVERISDDGLRLITLGSPRFDGDTAKAELKTANATAEIQICKQESDDGTVLYRAEGDVDDAEPGDRVCFLATPLLDDEAGIVQSPFLDNRIGCHVLCELAADVEWASGLPVNLVIGATACEEMGGYGAPVLARAVAPDSVIVLDATYEDVPMGILMGGGPVLTVSDASVLLSMKTRDRIAGRFREHGLPLQMEIYNYSGTDARAFPHAGLAATVLPLLIATTGNHSPRETAKLGDITSLIAGVKMLAADA